MIVKFSKYHGLGNDFIMMPYQEFDDLEDLIVKICDRHTGVGADGLILVKQDPLEMVYYNQDGTRAPMCGNGIRCFAAYCYDENICQESKYTVKTLAGDKIIHRLSIDPFVVKVDMQEPIQDNELLNVDQDENVWGREIYGVMTYSIFMATVHTVVFVDDAFDVKNVELGKKICHHPLFKKQTNVNFVQVIDDKHLKVMTYERGCGVTLACGTGACASAVIANKLGYCQSDVDVELKLGHLIINVDDHVFMSGPAKKICEGGFNYD